VEVPNHGLAADSNEVMLLIIVVDAGGRCGRAIPTGYYGNAFALPIAVSTAGELCKNPVSYAVGLVKEAKDRVDLEYMRSAANLIVRRSQCTWGRHNLALRRPCPGRQVLSYPSRTLMARMVPSCWYFCLARLWTGWSTRWASYGGAHRPTMWPRCSNLIMGSPPSSRGPHSELSTNAYSCENCACCSIFESVRYAYCCQYYLFQGSYICSTAPVLSIL
jgi:hypothetical protein